MINKILCKLGLHLKENRISGFVAKENFKGKDVDKHTTGYECSTCGRQRYSTWFDFEGSGGTSKLRLIGHIKEPKFLSYQANYREIDCGSFDCMCGKAMHCHYCTKKELRWVENNKEDKTNG